MNIYTREEVREATLRYFNGDELATDVWIDKYCLKTRDEQLLELTPYDMHHRLAREFARIETNYPNPMTESEIYDLFKDFRYIVPAGSPMYGVGNNNTITSLSNCFVIGDNQDADSYGSIMRTDEEQIQIMKRRGGVGHDISHLRPSGSLANNSVLGGLAGATLYMERYSNSTREVAQDGRRGALILTIDVRHPDTEKFVDMKLELGKVTGANVSVKLSDEFVMAVRQDAKFIQRFPIDADISSYVSVDQQALNKLEEHIFIDENLESKIVYIKVIRARDLWDKIIKNAHASAEPGVLFWDNILRESPSNLYGEDWREQSCNPCAELPLPQYSSCILMSMNLYSYVNQPFTENANFDMELFKSHVMKAQRLIDDLVDLEIEKVDRILDKIKTDPEPEDIKRVEKELWLKIRSKLILGRRTGLGITAEGDMLAALGLRYGSNEAISFSQIVHSTMATRSYMSSIDMAEERGAFTICDPSVETNPFLERVKSRMSLEYLVKWDKFGRRNIANLTIAPAGTVSLMTQTTSGVEPLFLPYYKRRYKVEDRSKATFIDESGDAWVEYIVIHPKFKKWYNVNWYKTSVELFDIDYHKEIEDYDEAELKRLFEMSPYYGATANDVDWRASVKMQGTIQQWVDHSISKTINLPNSATVEQVNDLYMLAWESGCKGVTVYRDGSRDGVLVSTDDLKIEDDDFDYMDAYKRPETLECDIYHKTALKQNWMVIVGLVNDRPYEIFAVRDVDNHVFPTKIDKGKITKVKSKTYMLEGYVGEKLYKIENIVKLMSDDEQTDTRKYSSMLRHRMHPRFIIDQIEEYATIASFDKVVQRVLRNYLTQDEFKSEKCPVCGTPLTMTEGCKKCLNCGYAKCG